MYCITSNDNMRYTQERFIQFVQCKALWEADDVHKLWKTIAQCIRHCGFKEMHVVSDMSWSLQQTDSGNHFTSDIPEQLYIRNEKEADECCNYVHCIQQGLKHNNM